MSCRFPGTKPWSKPISTPLIILSQLKPASCMVSNRGSKLLAQISTDLTAVVILNTGIELLKGPLIWYYQQTVLNYRLRIGLGPICFVVRTIVGAYSHVTNATCSLTPQVLKVLKNVILKLRVPNFRPA